MHYIITLFAIMLFPLVAAAQDDVSLFAVSGTYTVKAQMGADTDTAEFCVVRVDLEPVIEYGCVPAAADAIVTMDFVVTVTTDIDAQIRGYAKDASGLTSAYSPNAGWIDFTRPSAPLLVP